jgi:antitoxin component of MazEF toxin-antitoxin module
MKSDNIRKITKNGQGTYYISIPKDLIKELGLRERQKVVVKKYGKNILIKDWKK